MCRCSNLKSGNPGCGRKFKSRPSIRQFHSKAPKHKPYTIKVTAPGDNPYSENVPPEDDVNKIIFINKPAPITKGCVYDADTKIPVCSEVEVINEQSNKSVDKLETDCPAGIYHSDAPKGTPYIIKVTAPGYEVYTENLPGDKDVNKDIFIHKIAPPPVKQGIVYDADTKEPVCASIEIVDLSTKTTVEKLKTDCPAGIYHAITPVGKKYELVTSSTDYVPTVENIQPNEELNKIIYIKKVKAAIAEGKLFDVTSTKSFVLPDILYDLNKYNLKPQYQDSLKDLINTMRAFPNIVIELGSHTDTRASAAYNEKLSYNRAKSVVDYLISKGIEPDRLVAKGYAFDVPRVLDKKQNCYKL